MFGGWRVGVCWSDWHVGLTTFEDGAWLYLFGPFGLFHEPEPLQMVGLIGLLTEDQKRAAFGKGETP